MDEKNFLEQLAATYTTTDSPQDAAIRSLALRAFLPHTDPAGNALEMGCDTGFMTERLSSSFSELTVVDGSSIFLEQTRARGLPNVRYVHALFEEFETHQTFDHIFLCYVLEHVIDPVALLCKARALLSARGKIFIVVPNARAMSRQLARHMGLIEDLYGLTDNDRRHGHRRTYDRVLLERDVASSGLTSIHGGGLMLKPFADFQMNALFNGGVIGASQADGLYKMGLEYPDFAGSLFSVCCSAP